MLNNIKNEPELAHTLKLASDVAGLCCSQADGRMLWWMYMLQFSLELVTNNKLVATLTS